MAKFNPSALCFAIFAVLAFASCSRNDLEAEKPVYLAIDSLIVDTDYAEEGTSHSKINTIWLFANGEPAGAFELPCTVPVLLNEGANDIRILPGIYLNGMSSSRIVYDPYQRLQFSLDYTPSGSPHADTIQLTRSQITTTYSEHTTVHIVEDFDGPGLNLEKTSISDTNISKTGAPEHLFTNPQDTSENNGAAGIAHVTSANEIVELATVDSYQLPSGGTNVYLEINYKSDVPFDVGILGQGVYSGVQLATVRINPREDWNKMYVNFVSELNAIPGSSAYKIFIRVNQGTGTGTLLLDNLKLVY